MTELPPDFAPAVVEAAEQATVGVLVAAEGPEGWRSEFVNAWLRGLLGAEAIRIPDDLPLSDDGRREIARWLGDGAAQTLTLNAVPVTSALEVDAVRIVASRADAGGRRAVVLFFYDMAARRAERALAESEARFRQLLDAAPDAVALGTRTRFHYANPALVRMLGYERMEDVTGVALREHLHPDDRADARRIVQALLATGKPQSLPRIRARRKDGSIAEAELQILGIEWGGERALLGVARDLAERRRVQTQLIRADRLAGMGTLAAGVAHEINNPLAYLMLNLQYLMRELPRFDGSQARLSVLLERLAEAEHGARRVSTIVGDLRSFAHPDEVERGTVSVTKAVVAAVKVASSEIRRRARLVETYDTVPPVEGSATRLEQVFLNLLINAAQAITDGNPDSNEIRIAVRPEPGRVIVEVSDTGGGIPAEILGRVFDPFFTTKPRGVGTGLGLPISRGIVTALGGEITVQSTVGHGTTFRVSLPALPVEEMRSSPTATLAPTDSSALRLARSRILVVDDEPLVADMVRRALSDVHDVTVATDAQTALDLVSSEPDFDLIFCDLLMPRMSGMDLYERLRAERPGVEGRVVFMTGGAFTERAAQFLATVPNPKLTKPFDLRALEELVARAVRPPS